MPDPPPTGMDIVRAFLPQSPFLRHFDLTIEHLAPDVATLRMAFDPSRTTVGDVVHGGAIATLVDMAVMACSFAQEAVPERLRGATVSLAVDYLDVAEGVDLLATGTVVRRGRSLCRCRVEVRTPDDRLVAQAQAAYRIG
jgi:uncharacterized protein (TIGR00369 family)